MFPNLVTDPDVNSTFKLTLKCSTKERFLCSSVLRQKTQFHRLPCLTEHPHPTPSLQRLADSQPSLDPIAAPSSIDAEQAHFSHSRWAPLLQLQTLLPLHVSQMKCLFYAHKTRALHEVEAIYLVAPSPSH